MSDKIDQLLKENKHIWKTKSAYWSFIRGGLRRGLWMRNPVKVEFKNKNRVRIVNPNEKTASRFPEIWACPCHLCGGVFAQNEVEVDHKVGHHSLTCEEDLINFFESIAFVTESELQLVCKPCHKIKSYAERMGISFHEAKIVKDVIELQQLGEDKNKLLQLGFTIDNIPTTKDKRRELLIKTLMES